MRTTKLVELVAAILATFLNLVLIPIIYTKSSAKMGAYKYFLLAYTITACIYSYCVSTALFTWYLPKNGFLFLCTVQSFPRWFNTIQLLLFAICYLGTIVILDWSFVYRLSILQISSQWIARRQYIPLALCASAFPIIATFTAFLYMAPTEETERAFKEEVLLALDVDLTQVFYVGGLFIVGGQLNTIMIGLIGTCNVFFCLGMAICVICWFKIGKKLKDLRRMTSSAYKQHYNFFTLLTLQTCLPLAFYAFPITIITIVGLAQINIEGFSYLCSTVLSFAQVFDPLLTIYFIREYRSFLVLKHKKLCSALGIKSHSVNVLTTDNSASAARHDSRINR